MTVHLKENRPFVVDASVIIDYQNAGSLNMLRLCGEHIAPIIISSLTPGNDAKQFTIEECDKFGFKVLELTPAQFQRVWDVRNGHHRAGGFNDICNLVLAEDIGCTLVTNDGGLWKLARQLSVDYIRGLRFMTLLVECDKLTPERAMAVAGKMAIQNSGYINSKILTEFHGEIENLLAIGGKAKRTAKIKN